MNNQKKVVRISARISPELYKRAKAEAARRQLPMSYLIGQGLQKILNKK